MRQTLAVLVGLGLVAGANAEEFDWEVTLDGTRVESDFTSSVFGTDGQFGVRSEVDVLSLGANWFIDGLVVGDQPRSEAAFLNRASSLSFIYERADVDTTVFGIGADGTTDNFSTDALSIGGRYVWEESGWFATGAYSSTDGDGSEITSLTLGFGRYIAERTSVGVTVGTSELDFDGGSDNSSGVILVGRHIGDLNEQWLYGVDLSLSNIAFGDASGQYTAEFALYPNNDLALRLSTSGPFGGGGEDSRVYGLSAGWFVMPELEINAGYQWTTFDDDDLDQDSDGVSLGLRYRF